MIQELIATALSWRAEFLERGIRRMLCDADESNPRGGRVSQSGTALRSAFAPRPDAHARAFSDTLFESPFISEKLGRNLISARRAVPSYLSARTFSLALFDTLTRETQGADVLTKLKTALDGDLVPHAGVRHQLQLMLDDAEGDLEKFRERVEGWFDDTMERVSGWYRRRAQIVMFVIGLGVAGGVNADTLDLTNRLWTDAPVRAALVQQAAQAAPVKDLQTLEAELEQRGGTLEAVKQFGLPLGWNKDNGRFSDLGFGKNQENPLGWLAGILIAAVALSFGAPFWFDALSKLGRLQIAGRPPQKAS